MDEKNVEQTAAEETPVENLEPATEPEPVENLEPATEPATEPAKADLVESQQSIAAETAPEDLGKSVDAAYPTKDIGPGLGAFRNMTVTAAAAPASPDPTSFESEIAHVFKRVHADLGARVDAIEKAFSDRVEAIEKDFADYRQKLHDAGIRLIS